jgi:hypothetical protein
MRYMAPEGRRRAPRREGQRTTLRVPEEVMDAARRLADELHTTPNDALVKLAVDGVAVHERRRRAQELAALRRAAVAQVGFADAHDFPSEAQVRAAILSGRTAP